MLVEKKVQISGMNWKNISTENEKVNPRNSRVGKIFQFRIVNPRKSICAIFMKQSMVFTRREKKVVKV